MKDAAGYTAGDAIYDLGWVRAFVDRGSLTGSVGAEERVLELLDRVQTWLARLPVTASQANDRRGTPEWMIPRIVETVDVDETSAELEAHLGEHPPLEAKILSYTNLEYGPYREAQRVPVRHLDCGCIADARPLIAWPPEPYDGMIFRLASCQEHSIAAWLREPDGLGYRNAEDAAWVDEPLTAERYTEQTLVLDCGCHVIERTDHGAEATHDYIVTRSSGLCGRLDHVVGQRLAYDDHELHVALRGKMADELDQHLRQGEAAAVAAAEQFIQAGTEEYGTG